MVDKFPDQSDFQSDIHDFPSRPGTPTNGQMIGRGQSSLVTRRFGRVQGVIAAYISSLHKPVKIIEGMDIPEKIEDVPFRQQDRRILNARKKRIIAKRIICFGITTCLTFLGLGIALIVIYCLFQKGKLLKNLLNKNKDVLLRCHESLKFSCFSKSFQTNMRSI